MTDRPRPQPRQQRHPPSPPNITTSLWDHSRRYAIFRGNELLGTTNLEFNVAFGARAAGRFHPAWHFRKYESVFRLYESARDAAGMRRYQRQLNALALELWDAGTRLDATVDLISPWSAQKWMLHVTITDPRFWSGRAQS